MGTVEALTAEPRSEEEKPTPPEPGQAEVKRQPLRLVNDHARQLSHLYWSKKRLAIPITVLAVVVAIGVVPFTRYALLGLVIQDDISVMVIDSRTDEPISKAAVVLSGRSMPTDARGVASFRSKVGYQSLVITKQYYQTYRQSQLVSLSANQNRVTVKLVALGRLVPVTVTNTITGKPVAGATVKVLDTEATTNASGVATVVLPATATNQQATISANDYNSTSGSVKVTDQTVAANTFTLTPSGKLYFLSNLSGKIDVVKTNLDGSDRQTVLAGTGYEDQYNTVLLASRDWKYLALYAQRQAAGNPEIDLIDTSMGSMTNIDEGDAGFTLIGWQDHHLVYRVDRSTVSNWQNGREALKSFDADKKTIATLVQTTASGSAQYDWIGQRFGDIYILGGKVVYTIDWGSAFNSYNSNLLNQKQASLNTINPDGTNNTVIKALGLEPGASAAELDVSITPYDGPNSLAVVFPEAYNNTYYEYQDGKIAPDSDITQQKFSGNYPTYLLSPSGNKTFWSVYADGKNSLNVGDQNGGSAKAIFPESDYSPYGWFTDNYVLVSKNSSELYIAAADGSSQPFKIANYYKPQYSYRGYGGGYGGL